MYNFKSFNLFSPTFVIISKFSSNSKTDWVQCWTLIYLLYCPAVVIGDAFMHIYCPSGNIPRILVLFIKELPSYIYLTLYSVWQLAAMWNYMDLNLKDEIWEIQAGILLFFKLLLGVNKKKPWEISEFWSSCHGATIKILIQLLYITRKMRQNIVNGHSKNAILLFCLPLSVKLIHSFPNLVCGFWHWIWIFA